jgi:nitrite reductase (NADH) small subunit
MTSTVISDIHTRTGFARRRAAERGRTPAWTAVCPYARLEPERGIAALLHGVQVALFRLIDGEMYAIDNRDPIGGAYVMSRGIVGTRGGVPVVASPLFKQAYDLRTGECLDVPGVAVPTYAVRCHDGLVQVSVDGHG